MQIVAIAGQLGMGKDVLADSLAERLNFHLAFGNSDNHKYWQRKAFANAVKDVFASSFGVSRDFIEQWKRTIDPPPGLDMNIRKALQFIGDGFRKIKGDIWIEIALRDDMIILSDSRYINEAKAVKKRGGLMFVLYRPNHLNDDPNPSEAQIRPILEFCDENLEEGPIPSFHTLKKRYGHRCPDEMQHYDYFLRNDGDLNALYTKAHSLVVPFIERIYVQD